MTIPASTSDTQKNRSYAFIGTGAIGGLYGAKLAKAGFDVHFLAHSDYAHIRDRGLIIDSIDGDFVLPRVSVYADAAAMPRCDVVAVTLKTTANNILPSVLPHIVKEDGVVLVMQNGLGAESEVAAIAAPARVMGVLCFVCVTKVGPGHIRHLDFGHVTIGEHTDDGKPSGITGRMKAVAADFTKANITVRCAPDLAVARWKKLVWNVPYNGLSVVLNALTDTLMKQPHSRRLVTAIMEEICAGALACGHPVEKEFIQEMLSYTDAMTPYKTSMKIDFDEKRPMEVESIFGAPLRAAQEAGASVPRMEMLYEQLKYLDETNRNPS
jgi:2-dehydropantoate 2-reductase